FFFSSRRRHTRFSRDWSSDVCSSDLIPVTDAEATVMEVLWQSSPRSSEDVVAAVAPATGWAEPTIKTLLNRLLNKGAISAERERSEERRVGKECGARRWPCNGDAGGR